MNEQPLWISSKMAADFSVLDPSIRAYAFDAAQRAAL